ncbi:Thermolabile hemolysin [Zancudomyces culisetae]|uniref:Thermolabile hemolysin n=1 Tax=Zancudomyces culisetae TaxID=1213189 RepID=A0A1R1PMA8_ZANCU|nr:Thermolabile hemolysin [Zancudomyces culisetae]|eukprot:OMH82108.1 Thermolabile hemolysin [Zancudomyces culisetae]
MLRCLKVYSIVLLSILITLVQSRRIIVFGDSWSDIGNIEGRSFTIPYWKGRFSNGPVWTEYLAYWRGFALVDYAVAGSVSHHTYFQGVGITYDTSVSSVYQQVDAFLGSFGGRGGISDIYNDIVVIDTGRCDVLYAIDHIINNRIGVGEFAIGFVDRVLEIVRRLRAAGYRRYLVTNIADYLRFPYFRKYSVAERNRIYHLIITINESLNNAIIGLRGDIETGGGYIRIVNLYSITALTSQEGVYRALNFANFRDACYNAPNDVLSSCDGLDGYLYFDDLHLTSRFHGLIGAIAHYTSFYSFGYSENSMIVIIQNYRIASITTHNNFLFIGDGYTTGVLAINAFTTQAAGVNPDATFSAYTNAAAGRDAGYTAFVATFNAIAGSSAAAIGGAVGSGAGVVGMSGVGTGVGAGVGVGAGAGDGVGVGVGAGVGLAGTVEADGRIGAGVIRPVGYYGAYGQDVCRYRIC